MSTVSGAAPGVKVDEAARRLLALIVEYSQYQLDVHLHGRPTPLRAVLFACAVGWFCRSPLGTIPTRLFVAREHGKSMSKQKSKKKSGTAGGDPNHRVIADNRKARHRFQVLDTLECGIALVGSEVKSLRDGRLSLEEAYGRVRNGEVWLMGSDIAEYAQASRMNHESRRPRKLLLHKREIDKFAGQAREKGLTLVPLKMYFKQGRAKVLLGLCRGRKLHDKREAMKQATAKRDISRAMRRR